MSPFSKFRNYFVGKAMSRTDDVFEKAKIDLLFSFSVFFFLFAAAFSILSFDKNWFSILLFAFGAFMLLATIGTLKITGRLMVAAYIYTDCL